MMTLCIVRNTWNFCSVSITMKVRGSPCREGTLEKVLWRIENGQGREEDIDLPFEHPK
jgi:NADH-quinone oxidoreductase subunit F